MSEKPRSAEEIRDEILDLLIEAEHLRTGRTPPTGASWPSAIRGAILNKIRLGQAEVWREAADYITHYFENGDRVLQAKAVSGLLRAKADAIEKGAKGHACNETLCPPKSCDQCEKEAGKP